MKKTLKVLAIVLMIIAVVMISTNVFAQELNPSDLQASYNGDDGGLATKAGQVMGMIRNVAVIASVIILMVLGVKYMLGSVEEKAEYKKTMMPYVIGCFLVFGITNILAIIVDITSGIL